MNDLVSRADVIRVIEDWFKVVFGVDSFRQTGLCRELRELSSVQSETYKEKLNEIASELSEKFAYMNTCLNERDIILSYLGVERSCEIHCYTDCTNTKCESHPSFVQPELPIKKKCTICPHCDNCDVNDDGTIAQAELCDDVISRQEAIRCCTFGRTSLGLIDELRRLPSAQPQKWIPCNEKLPAAQTEVIVSCVDDSGDTKYRYTTSGWVTTNGEYWIVNNEINPFVVAWMSMPEPWGKEG